MTEPTKYLIVAREGEHYARTISTLGVDPGRCFWMRNLGDAVASLNTNAMWGIPCVVIDSMLVVPRPYDAPGQDENGAMGHSTGRGES